MRRNLHHSLSAVIIAVTIMLFLLSVDVYAQPTLENLQERNVSLNMKGFAFASGLRKDAKGRPNGDGSELVKSSWCGSGFIVKSDGTILTNYHVAKRALEGKAVFENGASYNIKHIKVYDDVSDIAVLKIDSTSKFPTVKLGNSDEVNVMDRIIAVGNTLCQSLAVTEGMINQVKKNDHNVKYQFRHSAIIAPGNSGGALYKGNEVIGINVAIRPPYAIHYAIPINLAKHLLTDPRYDREILFRDAFPTSVEGLINKSKLLNGSNGSVSAASGDTPGVFTYTYTLNSLEDYILFLQAEEGRDLALIVKNAQGIIGFSDLRNSNLEALLLSSDNYQEIAIYIMNYSKAPVNYALKVFQIVW